MLYDVIKADYLEGYKLKIEFENGYSGIVDLSQYPQKGGVFSKFSDLSFFRNFKVSKSLGTIVWNKEVDIAPETLYAKCEQITSANALPSAADLYRCARTRKNMTLPRNKQMVYSRPMIKSGNKRTKKPLMVKEFAAPYGRNLTSVSLFSGGGGMDIGIEAAGFRNLACVEFDPNAAETLRFNANRKNAETRIVEADIRMVDPLTVVEPGIDLLHGGPPCQAFSLIGKRGSLEDARGLLLFEMIRFAAALKPRTILLEQVKGLLSAPDEKGETGGVFKRFTHELEKLGYCVKWTVLCAADYGVPQLRERVFIVAQKGRNGFSFPPPTHAEDPEDTPLFTLKPYVGSGAVISGLPPPVAKGTSPTFPNHVDVTPDRDRERIHPVAEGGFLAGTLNAPPDLKCNLTKKDTTKYRRLHRLEPSLTLRCGEIFFHPIEDRYLTPREYLRLHGYPDEHILCGPIRSRSGTVKNLDQHRLVANSVPPPLAQAVAAQIMKVLA